MTGAEQRVVGAAEQQRVDVAGAADVESRGVDAQQRRERTDVLDVGAVELSGLDQRHQLRRGVLVHLDERVLVLDRLEVGVRADGRPVAITPTRRLRVASAAADAPGRTTPRIGTS